jgi:hypothetical protein
MATKNDRNKLRISLVAALAAATIVAAPGTARADDVTPNGKGIVGGGLLGGEIVVFGEALFGVHSTAAYLLGAGVGAAGGAVGGYFIEQNVSDGRVPVYMLAGGIALLIPAIVVTLDATRYLPNEGAREDKPVQLPPSDPGKPGGSSVVGAEPATSPAPPPATPSGTEAPTPAPVTPPATGGGGTQAPRGPQASLFNLRGGDFAVGLPLPDVRPTLGSADRARYGATGGGSELRFPLMHVTF